MRWTARPSAGARMAEQTPPDKRLAAIVDSYLTPAHRDDPGHGCAIPTLGAEIARESPKTRKAFAAKLEQMIDMLAAQIPDVPRKAARKQAMASLATMMGTLVLARVAGSGEFSDEILAAGRDAVLDRAAAAKPARRSLRRKAAQRGTDAAAAIACDIGRMSLKRGAMPAFSQFRRAQKPFPNAAKPARCRKTGPCKSFWRNPCAQSDILSAAARSRAHRAGRRTYSSR